jgi:hypothetical protein
MRARWPKKSRRRVPRVAYPDFCCTLRTARRDSKRVHRQPEFPVRDEREYPCLVPLRRIPKLGDLLMAPFAEGPSGKSAS